MQKWIFLIIAAFVLSACSLEVSLEEINKKIELAKATPVSGTGSTLSMAPSMQSNAKDELNEMSIKSVVGEVATTEDAKTQDGQYRAEISISYQHF